MAKRGFAILILILFIVTSVLVPLNWISNTQAAIEGVEPPAEGDWIIDEDTNVTEETIILNGNIIVLNNAILNLVDTTIKVNSTYDGEYDIIITGGASLVADNTVFTRNGDHDYGFLFDAGTSGGLEGSTVEYAQSGGDEGMLLFSPDITINNTVFRESEYGLIVGEMASITNSTFYNNTVGVLLFESLAANNVATDNAFEWNTYNNSAANVRFMANTTIHVDDQYGDPLENAMVYLNDTFDNNRVENVTDANGEFHSGWLVPWEVQPDGTNIIYEPFNLTATKFGRSNITQVYPSQGSDLKVELPQLPDLVVDEADIMWGPKTMITIVPAGRYNETEWYWTILGNDDTPPDGWNELGFNDTDWELAPAPFGDQNLGGGGGGVEYNTEWAGDSIAYFRHYFTLPENITIFGGTLSSSANNYGSYYVNGEEIFSDWRQGGGHGAEYWNEQSTVRASALTSGQNIMAAFVEETGNTQWFDAQLELSYMTPGRSSLVVNHPVSFMVPVENQGIRSATGVEVKLYNGSNLIDTKSVDLQAGEKKNLFFDWDPTEHGNQTIRIEVDEPEDIEEEIETNNNDTLDIFVGNYGVSLTIDRNTTATPFNESVMFNLSVENIGDIDDNVTLSVQDLPNGWYSQVDPSLLTMEPDDILNSTMTIKPERGADTGNYTFHVVATSEHEIGSSTRTEPIVLPGRDNTTEYRYSIYNDNDDVPSGWEEPGFNDTDWDTGPGPFGNQENAGIEPGTDWQSTNVSGNNGDNDWIATRHYFDYKKSDAVIGGILHVAYNNYYAAYINGYEIKDCTGWGGGCYGSDVSYWQKEESFDEDWLVDGLNVFAVLGGDSLYQGGDNNQWLDVELLVEVKVILGSGREVTIDVEPTHDFDLLGYSAARNHATNTTQIYPMRLTNFGHFDEVLEAELTISDSTGDWTAHMVNDTITAAAGANDQFGIEVFGEPSLTDEDYLNLSVDVWMRDLPWIGYTYYLNLTAEPPFHEFTLDEYHGDEEQLNGTSVTYYIGINNLGNVMDTFVPELTTLNSSGLWDVSFTTTSLSINAYSEAELGIIVETDEDLRFWDHLNLSVNLTIVNVPDLFQVYTLNLTPIFDDHDPPDTQMVPMDRYVRDANVTLEWEVTRDRDDTAYFFIYYKTMAPNGTISDFEQYDSYTSDIRSTTFEAEHGWVYYFYSLGQDGSNNLELDRGTYDTYFIVDLEPPESGLWLTELGQGVAKGVTNETELGLNWEPVNATDGNPDFDYTIQVRNRTLTGTFGPWITIEGLNNVSIQQGEYNPLDGHLYQFRSIATDAAGWVEDKSGWDVQVIIDASPPRSGLERPPAITTSDTHTLNVVYDSKEDVKHLQVHYAHFPDGEPSIEYTWLNGGSFQGASIPDELTFSQLKDGQRYIYRLMATDDNDNQEQRNDMVEYYTGNGSHDQFYQLSKLPVPAPTVPYSRVTVVVEGVEEEVLLEYFDWDDIPANKDTAFHLDYDTGMIHFGDTLTGKIPYDGARLRITYDAYDAWTVVDTSGPNPPSTIHRYAFNAEAGTATLSWHPSSSNDVVAYLLEVATEKTGPWSEVRIIPAPAENRDINDIVVDGLSADTTYHFHVIAIDRADWRSAPNNPISVNEKPVASNGDDDDDGSSSGALLILLLVLLVFAGAMGFILNKRKADIVAPVVEGPSLAPTGQLVPVTGEVAATTVTAGAVVAAVEQEEGFEPVGGSQGEYSCLACGAFFKPEDDGPDLTCPACGQIGEGPDGKTPPVEPDKA